MTVNLYMSIVFMKDKILCYMSCSSIITGQIRRITCIYLQPLKKGRDPL